MAKLDKVKVNEGPRFKGSIDKVISLKFSTVKLSTETGAVTGYFLIWAEIIIFTKQVNNLF